MAQVPVDPATNNGASVDTYVLYQCVSQMEYGDVHLRFNDASYRKRGNGGSPTDTLLGCSVQYWRTICQYNWLRDNRELAKNGRTVPYRGYWDSRLVCLGMSAVYVASTRYSLNRNDEMPYPLTTSI
jgi:hypothetical protein